MNKRISFARFLRRRLLLFVPFMAIVITAFVALSIRLRTGTWEGLDASAFARAFLVACVIVSILFGVKHWIRHLFSRHPVLMWTLAWVAVGVYYAVGGVETMMFGSVAMRNSYTWHGFLFALPCLLMAVRHVFKSGGPT